MVTTENLNNKDIHSMFHEQHLFKLSSKLLFRSVSPPQIQACNNNQYSNNDYDNDEDDDDDGNDDSDGDRLTFSSERYHGYISLRIYDVIS